MEAKIRSINVTGGEVVILPSGLNESLDYD